jgi:prepilin-type N-terminal cleavage/methylation domain-containing protein
VRTRCAKGFTLVELLVVIAITAVLATLLLPVLVQAKTRTKNTVCSNNLRQVGLALLQYANTYDAYVPGVIHSPCCRTEWNQLLGPFLGRPVVPFDYTVGAEYPRPLPPFICPVYSAGMRNMPFDPADLPRYSYNFTGTINISGVVPTRFLGLGRGLFDTDENGNLDARTGPIDTARESDVIAPSEMLALGDPFSRSEAPEYDSFYNFYDFNPVPKNLKNPARFPAKPQTYQNATKVHGARFNRFLCDGHIESENFRKPFVATDAYLARWNLDHQPHRDSWLGW